MASGSSHHGLNPRGSFDEARSRHPDLDEHGNVRWEASLPPDRREFLELWRDPVKRAAFMDGVAARQSREHPDVQRHVGGVQYNSGDPLTDFQEYQKDLRWGRELWEHDKELTSYDVQNMTLDEYNERFDSNGRPKDGYSFRRTDRDLVADDQAVERFSRDENLRQSRDGR